MRTLAKGVVAGSPLAILGDNCDPSDVPLNLFKTADDAKFYFDHTSCMAKYTRTPSGAVSAAKLETLRFFRQTASHKHPTFTMSSNGTFKNRIKSLFKPPELTVPLLVPLNAGGLDQETCLALLFSATNITKFYPTDKKWVLRNLDSCEVSGLDVPIT